MKATVVAEFLTSSATSIPWLRVGTEAFKFRLLRNLQVLDGRQYQGTTPRI